VRNDTAPAAGMGVRRGSPNFHPVAQKEAGLGKTSLGARERLNSLGGNLRLDEEKRKHLTDRVVEKSCIA